MAKLDVHPEETLEVEVGGYEVYTVDLTTDKDGGTGVLAGDTIDTVGMEIINSAGVDVAADYGGDSSHTDGVITFGVIGYAAGSFTVRFTVTCNETLPSGDPRVLIFEFALEIS